MSNFENRNEIFGMQVVFGPTNFRKKRNLQQNSDIGAKTNTEFSFGLSFNHSFILMFLIPNK